MKGLLLKDFYVILRYFKFYLIIIPLFLSLSIFSDSMFISLYPMILLSMVSLNLIAYDESFRWDRCSAALPCSRTQIVVAKYLINLCCVLVILVMTALVQLIGGNKLNLLVVAFAIGMISPSIALPILYKFGSTKGRLVSIAILGVMVGVSTAFDVRQSSALPSSGVVSGIIIAFSLLLFGVSMLLSIRIYKKREF